MLRVKLNNNLISEELHSSIDTAEITIRRADGDGNAAYSFGESIDFYEDAARQIFQTLVDNTNARSNLIEILIVEDCCDDLVLFSGKITSDLIEWCETVDGSKDCEKIKCRIEEYTEESKILACMQSTSVNHNENGFRSRTHPFVRYCIEVRPDLMQFFIIYVYILLYWITLMLYPIVAVFAALAASYNLIVSFLNTTFGTSLSELDFNGDAAGTSDALSAFTEFRNSLETTIVGCNLGHYAPYLRDYIQNGCDKCGAIFESSILTDQNSPFYNAMWFVAPTQKTGETVSQASKDKYFSLNSPTLTVDKFLNELKGVWNANWIIRGNKVLFERKDLLSSNTTISNLSIINLCYNFAKEPRPQFATLSYSPDFIETAGNEALHRNYRRIQNYDPTNTNLNLRGERKYLFRFASPRFRNDGVDSSVLSFFEDAIILGLFFSDNYKNYMIMSDNIASTPKLLIHDTNSGFDKSLIKRTVRTINTDEWDYNEAFILEGRNEIYNNFFAIDDPLNSPAFKDLEYSLTVEYDCDLLRNLFADPLGQFVEIPYNSGTVFNSHVTNLGVDGMVQGTIEQIIIKQDYLEIKGKL